MAKKTVKKSGRINKQREIENKKRKKRKSAIVLFFIILVIGGISTYLLISPAFAIQEISIKGNNKVSTQQIYQLAEIQKGDNIFSKLSSIMKVKLKQNGYIKNVEIIKKYPNKVEINITEREQQFQIKTENEAYIYIDEQGYILGHGVDKLEIPTIIGIDITIHDIGTLNRLKEMDLYKMENILQIREECRNIEIADKITQIQVSEEYIIRLGNEGIEINLGDATNLKNRMYYVNAILKQEAGNEGTIYVNGNLNEGFSAYFRAN